MATVLAPDETLCPYCGETIKAKAVLCRYCRSDLVSTPDHRRPAGLILGLGTLLLGLVVVGGVMWYGYRLLDSEGAPALAQPSTEQVAASDPASPTSTAAPSPAPPTATPPTFLVPVLVVQAEGLNVRAGPDVAYPSLGVVEEGTRLEAFDITSDNGWHRVRATLNGERVLGWVAGGYVAAESDSVPEEAYLAWTGEAETLRAQPAPPTPTPRPAPTSTPRPNPTALVTSAGDGGLSEVIGFARDDVAYFWNDLLAPSALRYFPPAIIEYRGSTETPCGMAGPLNAYYCARDFTIYYDRGLMEYQFLNYGDYTVIHIFAHEWGHHIQAIFDVAHDYAIDAELEADCLAGVYAQDAAYAGLLDGTDPREAMLSLYDAGDGDDIPWYDADAHGAPTQRVLAFLQGYEYGFDGC